MTQGFVENAVQELREVVKLQPSDRLSAQLLTQLSAGKDKDGNEAPSAASPDVAASASAAVATTPGAEGKIVGTWKASPARGTDIELSVNQDGSFRWTVTSQGKARPIEGKYTYGNGILAMSQNDSNALVGRVAWKDDSHFGFQAMGGGPNDPGLSFSK